MVLGPKTFGLEIDSHWRGRIQREGESAMTYCYDVIYLCSKGDPDVPEPIKVQHLLRGLNSNPVIEVYPFLTPLSDSKELIRQVQIDSKPHNRLDDKCFFIRTSICLYHRFINQQLSLVQSHSLQHLPILSQLFLRYQIFHRKNRWPHSIIES